MECSQVLTVKQCVVSGFNASRAVILMSRTGMAVEKRKFSKILNWRHYLLNTCAKRKENCQNHWEWLKRLFRNVSKPWEWFRCKKLGVQKIMGNAQTCFGVDGRTEYSRCQDYALHLVEPARCGVLWDVETEWNHHRESVSNVIDAFESSIEGETAIVPRETRQSYPLAWQCPATCRKTGQDILVNAKMGGLTSIVVLCIRCSFQLPLVLIDGTRPG